MQKYARLLMPAFVIAGLIIIVMKTGWLVALGIFLLLIGNNIDQRRAIKSEYTYQIIDHIFAHLEKRIAKIGKDYNAN